MQDIVHALHTQWKTRQLRSFIHGTPRKVQERTSATNYATTIYF